MRVASSIRDAGREDALTASGGFDALFAAVERPLTVALVARYGPEVGREAALDALAWAWEHWDRVEVMRNPAGYLYRVGQTAARRGLRTNTSGQEPPDRPNAEPDLDVELSAALATLTVRQRQVAVLTHGYGYTHREVAALLGISRSSVQNHADRGLAKLRRQLEDD